MAEILTVNVLHTIRDGRWQRTGIDKRPVDGPVRVGRLGLERDRQLNESAHGGVDRAVYAYASEDTDWWAHQLHRKLTPGQWGENLTTIDLDVTSAVIGERWQLGEPGVGPLVEVRQPRTPCDNLSTWIGIDRFHREFAASGRVGAMLKVIEEGDVCAGMRIVTVHRPEHEVTVSQLARGAAAADLEQMLASGVELAPNVRAKARRLIARASI